MDAFKKIIGLLDRFGKWWSLVVLLIILLPTLEAMVFRLIFNRPTAWTQELSTIIFGIYFMIGAAYCESREAHISMDVFSMHYKGWARIALETAKLICCIVTCFILLRYGMPLALRTIRTLERSESYWAPYLWPSRLAIPIGAVLLLIRTIGTFVAKTGEAWAQIKGAKSDAN